MNTQGFVPMMAVAVVWAAVILGVASVLRGSPEANSVLILIGGGAAMTILLLGGWLRRRV